MGHSAQINIVSLRCMLVSLPSFRFIVQEEKMMEIFPRMFNSLVIKRMFKKR